jgi:hypothetical protein
MDRFWYFIIKCKSQFYETLPLSCTTRALKILENQMLYLGPDLISESLVLSVFSFSIFSLPVTKWQGELLWSQFVRGRLSVCCLFFNFYFKWYLLIDHWANLIQLHRNNEFHAELWLPWQNWPHPRRSLIFLIYTHFLELLFLLTIATSNVFTRALFQIQI